MAYPITIYKSGEQKTIEYVDRLGWLEDGWSLEPEEKPETEKPPAKHRKEAVKVEAE